MTEFSINDNKRIAKNTLFLYGRMLFTMLLSLYGSRLILNILGVEDFGIYNIVGGFVAIMSIISAGFSSASQRFISDSIGEGNSSKTHLTFLTILNIHFVFALILIVVGETVGFWFVNNYLVIPVDRLYAANFVYQCSLFTVIISLISIPYTSLIMSHEHLNIYAMVSVVESVLKLCGIIVLKYIRYDSLILYAIFLMLIAITIRLIYGVYCRTNFIESKYKLIVDKKIFKEILKYVSWAYLGNFAGIFKEQGMNVLINLFFGVTINAARAVSMQIYNAVNSLSVNIITAFSPQITKKYASGEKDKSLSLTMNSTRYSLYLLYFPILPIILETRTVLELWLGTVPEYSVIFVKLILVLCISRAIGQPTIMFYLAIGNIKKSQIISSIMVIVSIFLCYFVYKLGGTPESSVVISIVTEIVGYFIHLSLIKELVPFKIIPYLKTIYPKVLLVYATSLCLPLFIHYKLNEGFIRLLIIAFASFLSIATMVYFIGITKSEKQQLNTFIIKKIHRER
jgi:O-antigen/teichoic acid export membrane protein